MEGGGWKVLMLLVNLSENDWGHGDLALESSLLGVLLIGDLGGNVGSELGGIDEGHDVGVVLENEDLLVEGGLIVRSSSDLDN